jgi:hypothetical protein
VSSVLRKTGHCTPKLKDGENKVTAETNGSLDPLEGSVRKDIRHQSLHPIHHIRNADEYGIKFSIDHGRRSVLMALMGLAAN